VIHFMNIALWIVQGILGLAFIMIGSMKVFRNEKAKAGMPWASKGFIIFIGVSEILGALGLILPFATGIVPTLTPIAAIALGVIMVLATGYHAKKKENKAIGMTIIFLVLLIYVAIGRF
jgi:uncharacterized membrane protein YphA (DoxX/SURF4 family)